MDSNRPATPLFSPACWEPGFQAWVLQSCHRQPHHRSQEVHRVEESREGLERGYSHTVTRPQAPQGTGPPPSCPLDSR